MTNHTVDDVTEAILDDGIRSRWVIDSHGIEWTTNMAYTELEAREALQGTPVRRAKHDEHF